MTASAKLRAKAAEKRAAAQKILDAVAAEPIVRDMNAEEKAAFDTLLRDVEVIKGQVAAMKALEDEEDAAEGVARSESAAAAERSRSFRVAAPAGESAAPAIHGDRKPYSFIRALRLAAEGKPIDGVEGEVNQEIARSKGQVARSLYLPTGSNPEIRSLMYPGQKLAPRDMAEIRRDLTTTTGAGSIFLIPELPLIELLRAKLVVKQLGATMLTDMHGTFAMIRQSGRSTVSWLGEGNSAANSNPTFDQVPFTPKVAIDLIPISRQFLNQSSLDAEAEIKRELANTMAREVDRVAINGTGSTQPLGILQNTAIQTNSAGLALGANGGQFTYNTAIAMEGQVAQYNADRGALAYLFSPSLRAELKSQPKVGTTFPVFTFETIGGQGEVNGYPALTTTNMPTNLTKGTGTNLKAAIFGDWADLVIAEWEGVDVLVNPFSLQASGGVLISMQMSLDVNVKHPESFAIVTDAV